MQNFVNHPSMSPDLIDQLVVRYIHSAKVIGSTPREQHIVMHSAMNKYKKDKTNKIALFYPTLYACTFLPLLVLKSVVL